MIIDDIKKSIELILEGKSIDDVVNEVGGDCEKIYTKSTTKKPKDGRRGGNRQRTHEQFIEEVRKMYGDEYEVLDRYTDSRTNIRVKHHCDYCNNHEWSPRPVDLLSSDERKRNDCPICRKIRIKNSKIENDTKDEKLELINQLCDEFSTEEIRTMLKMMRELKRDIR